MRDYINTILGEKRISDLGLISPHEHIIIDLTNQFTQPATEEKKQIAKQKISMHNIGLIRRDPYVIKENLLLSSVKTAIKEMNILKRAGADTVVELTLRDIGRDIRKLRRISKRANINIIIGCGLYTYDTVRKEDEALSAEAIAERMIRELTMGIDGTNIKAGVIGEIGTSDSIRPIEEKSLRAAGLAYQRTKLPIYVHLYPWGEEGLKALDILEEYGVRPADVCVCHLDVSFNYKYIVSVLKRGAYVEFDNFGKEFDIQAEGDGFAGGDFAKDGQRVEVIKSLIADGFSSQLLLANDICLKGLLHSYGGWGYDHIITNIAPMMKAKGIEQEAIDEIIRLNPIRFLSGRTK